MFLTADILRQYDACGPGIKYIERFYPNGAEVIDIIRDRHIDKRFLHWGRDHLTITEEEQEAYRIACRITNTIGYWHSVDVSDSKYVSRSKKVSASQSVFESVEVSDSSDIVLSEDVTKGQQIFQSSIIEDSKKVLKSKNVLNSENICNSTTVTRSINILDSIEIFNSSEIIDCKKVTDSHFCYQCENIRHCLFCYGISDVEYCIFNQPVDKEYYEVFLKQYKKYQNEFLAFVQKWPKELSKAIIPSTTKRIDHWYKPLSQKFWKWVKTLPNFDQMILYKITMSAEAFIN